MKKAFKSLKKRFLVSTNSYVAYHEARTPDHEIMGSLKPNDLVFDIGAHKGAKSIPFLGKGIRVVMVEPQPKCIEILRADFKRTTLAEIVPMGVGKEAGVLQLSINSQVPVLSTFSEHWKAGRFADRTWNEEIDVPITTLDQLIEKYGSPHFIKIDVEGFEVEVLVGLTKKSGIVSFEFTSEFLPNAIKCLDILENLSYTEFTYSVAEELEFNMRWSDRTALLKSLTNHGKETRLLWGDIYAR